MQLFEMIMTALAGTCLVCMVGACRVSDPTQEDDCSARRVSMVQQLRNYNIKSPKVLDAMAVVPRQVFIPEDYRRRVDPYGDHPCPIGNGQTISQPYMVAYMTEKLEPWPGMKVLEIGTGSGYQAAILAACGAEVYSIEIIPELAQHARTALEHAGYKDVKVRTGDGYQGWPEYAPFDAVIVTCAPEDIPPRLVEQLRDGGRMILPVGKYSQRLVVLRKQADTVDITEDLPVRFVPMVHGD